MRVDVVIPAARGDLAARLIASLALQTRTPDLVTVVSNEASLDLETKGLSVDLLRYDTDAYSVGFYDVSLRRNLGAFTSPAEVVIFQDDDQLAPPNMVETALAIAEAEGLVWGHHRFVDFNQDLWALRVAPPEMGIEREHPPNHLHGWYSCYAGMFGIRKDMLLESGGFDMAFQCRHGNEDQQLGRRLMNQRGQSSVFIFEPPFAWHPTVPDPHPVVRSNTRDHPHDLVPRRIAGVLFSACRGCPYQIVVDHQELMGSQRPVVPFQLSAVSYQRERAPH